MESGFIIAATVSIVVVMLMRSRKKKQRLVQATLTQKFPDTWRTTLTESVIFYNHLSDVNKLVFEKRVQLFLATKTIEAVDTQIDDAIRLMVAASAIIPTFAFPGYNYPSLHTILIYPNSFDEEFQTERFSGHKEFIVGMVGNRSLKGTVILSKPDLLKAFDGLPHKENVGVHEFVHLLDMEDGVIDGIPQLLIEHAFVGPWLHEIKKEMDKIVKGKSDINPYALTNNAEFLAVVSEYFFDSPDTFQKRHAELYSFLSTIFKREANH